MNERDILEKLSNLDESTRNKQTEINLSEIWHIWNTLIKRYDVIERTQMFKKYARDEEFKIILQEGLNILKKQVENTENLAIKYGIPLPERAPEAATIDKNVEEFTDKHIYRQILRGMQSFLTIHLSGFIKSKHTSIRRAFQEKLTTEIDLYDKMLTYGKLKGWTSIVPKYRT